MDRVLLVGNDERVGERARQVVEAAIDHNTTVVQVVGPSLLPAMLKEGIFHTVVVHVDSLSAGDHDAVLGGLLDPLKHRCPVVILTNRAESEYASKVLRMGAMGYVLTDARCSELVEALVAVRQGRRYLCRLIRDTLASEYIDLIGDGEA